VDKGIWEEAVRKDANEEAMGSRDRCKGGVYAMKREGVPFVERGKRGGERVRERTAEEGLYLAVKVTTNGAGILCGKEGWEEEDGPGLPISE